MPSLKHRLAAMRTLQEGGIIACPTEAVWGYSCDPWSQPAVQHLLRLKRRDPRKGLILVASHERQVMPLLESLTWDLRERLIVVLGGSYRDAAGAVGCGAMQRDTPNWNRSDPQFPKSVWWLADAPHVGMRVVCDAGSPSGASAARGAPDQPSAPQKETKDP